METSSPHSPFNQPNNSPPSTATSMVKDSAQAAKEFLSPKDGIEKGERKEGEITKQIESVTTKIPSGLFLSAALASIGISAVLQGLGRKRDATFVGQWVPTILILGLYNKMVKLEGSE